MELKRQRGSVGGEALPFVLKALPEMERGFMPGSKQDSTRAVKLS